MDNGEDDDALAFAEAVRGAQPIPKGAGRVAGSAKPASGRRSPPAAEHALLFDPATALTSVAFTLTLAGEQIEGRASGVDARAVRRLKDGEPAIEARLDLHGHSREPALAALERFVQSSRAASRRAVLVIHGRGARSSAEGPVLKPLVWRWLASSRVAAATVLAFSSARPADGGDGATLVLLRKPRGRNEA
jgi:DNA-nicking Smr family endonuclease